MALHRFIDGSDPVGSTPIARGTGVEQERRSARTSLLASGTLACPRCDVPVTPAAGRVSVLDALHCPYCRHAATVRDFLSLTAPTRPTRVELHVVQPTRR